MLPRSSPSSGKNSQASKRTQSNSRSFGEGAGELNRTLYSTIFSVEGDKWENIVNEWEGTIQWIAQSPYRIYHKRKNWFIAVNIFQIPDLKVVNDKELQFQTLRASGPGGQHVNKTESAVRVTHVASGLSVTASDQRSQIMNKKLAIERLIVKLTVWNKEQLRKVAQENWNNHNNLERGNAVKIINQPLT